MKRYRGFTLIEMMITVVVLAILLTIAVPSFRAFILNNRLTTQANEFLTSLQLARSEAIKRGAEEVRMTVDVLPADAGNEWGPGWHVWVDEDGDGSRTDAETIRSIEALSGDNVLNSITANASEYVFNGNGTVSVSDRLELTDERTSGGGCATGERPGREIQINLSGRAVVSAEKCL